MLSYAGIPLTVPTNKQQESLQAWLDSWSDVEFSGKNWPGNELEGMTFLPTQPQPQPKLGSLYWPYGASRWAVGHFVCSDYQLNLIRLALNPGSSTVDGYGLPPIPGLLRMATSSYIEPLEALLYMLPPRPIHQIAGSEGLNLLTLVDQRYYWWYNDSGTIPIDSTSTWLGLYSQLAVRLNTVLNVDPVSLSYFKPAPEFTNYYQAVPLLLDAIAYNCGHRVTCTPLGIVNIQQCATDVATLYLNILDLTQYGAKILGGSFDRTDDFETALPAAVRNVTRVWKNDVPTSLAPLYHLEDVTLLNKAGFNASTGSYNFAGVRGFSGVKTFNDTFHGSESSAFANEAALALQIALDYWTRIANAFLDVTVAHPFPIIPEGLHDIEWSYTRGRVSTRIYKSLWNWEPDTLLHGDGNGPFQGNSTYEPWRVEPFFAKITSVPTGTAYPWIEVIPATGGTFIAKPSGRSGVAAADPAYDFNGGASVAANTYVLMWRGFQNAAATKQEWVFTQIAGGGAGTITVQESDGSPICTDISKLIFEYSQFIVTCNGDGSATIQSTGGGTGKITVKDSTGTPTCTDIDTVIFDHATMTVVCNGDGSATVAVRHHTETVLANVVCNDDGTITKTYINIEVVG